MIWFIADTHFGHANIIRFCNRPFRNHWEMDKIIMNNWNSVVDNGDDVYFLGDMALCAPGYLLGILAQLKGNIYFIRGNHDKTALNLHRKHSHIFRWVKDYYSLRVPDKEISGGSQRLFLIHYPMLTWNGSHKGSWNLYGHVHNAYVKNLKPAQLNVGVDVNHFAPISYEEVKIKITKQLMKVKG